MSFVQKVATIPPENKVKSHVNVVIMSDDIQAASLIIFQAQMIFKVT